MAFEFALPANVDPLAATRDARLRRMVSEHLDGVWRALRRFGVPEAAADDATQKVFVVAARRLAEIEEGGERQYLLGIAWRVASDTRHALRRRREVPIDEIAAGASLVAPARQPDHALEHKETLELLAALLGEMPQALRDAFVLFELEDLNAAEVARVLNVPVGTVASRVRRAREHIRKHLEGGRTP